MDKWTSRVGFFAADYMPAEVTGAGLAAVGGGCDVPD